MIILILYTTYKTSYIKNDYITKVVRMITPKQFNAWFKSSYDKLDPEENPYQFDGSVSPPSENTLKKAYFYNPKRKLWKGPELKLFTLP